MTISESRTVTQAPAEGPALAFPPADPDRPTEPLIIVVTPGYGHSLPAARVAGVAVLAGTGAQLAQMVGTLVSDYLSANPGLLGG